MLRRTLPAAVFAVSAALATAADPPPRDPWPVFRGTPGMTGVGEAKLPDKLEQVWEAQCGDAIEGAPAILGGVVYVASMDRHLYALDYATGKPKWKTKLGAMKSSPAVKGNRVYAGDLEGKLHAVDAATGKALWAFDTGGEIHSGANFTGDDVLIGSHSGSLFRVNPKGEKVWEFTMDQPVNGAPAVAGGRAFVAGCDSVLHSVDLATGKGLGTVDIGGQAGATAAVDGDHAFVGTMSNQVLAVDWKQSKPVWKFEAKRRQQPFYSSAALTPKLVIVGSRDKKLYALDRATGNEVWAVTTEGNVDASPVVVGTRAYVGSASTFGEFYTIDLADGRVVHPPLTLNSAVLSSAAVGPDALVVGTDKGRVVKLGAKK